MLEILSDAGRDKQRHPLVKVQCSFCGWRKIMRRANLKRSKSCGCVKADRFRQIVAQRKKKPIPLPESVFSEFDNSTMTPFEICQAVQAKGLFVPCAKPKGSTTR